MAYERRNTDKSLSDTYIPVKLQVAYLNIGKGCRHDGTLTDGSQQPARHFYTLNQKEHSTVVGAD